MIAWRTVSEMTCDMLNLTHSLTHFSLLYAVVSIDVLMGVVVVAVVVVVVTNLKSLHWLKINERIQYKMLLSHLQTSLYHATSLPV